MTTSRWILLVVVVGTVSYAGGRYSARTETPPGEAEERVQEAISAEETREVQVEEVAHVEAKETQAATVQASSDRVRIVYRERAPDGSERSLEVDAESSRLAIELQASRNEVARLKRAVVGAWAVNRVETREVERRVEVERALPDWRISGMAGLDIRAGLVWGAQVERRVLGPVYVGAWGLSAGAVGIGVGVGF